LEIDFQQQNNSPLIKFVDKKFHHCKSAPLTKCFSVGIASNCSFLINTVILKKTSLQNAKMHILKEKLSLFAYISQFHRIHTITVKKKSRRPRPFFSRTLQFLVGWCHVMCHVTHLNDYDYLPSTVISVCNKFCSIYDPFIATIV